jgi:3-oxoacyl-[acyl-carrier-protein] synthase-3
VKPFVVNNHDRLVFPANFLGELDFSVIDDMEQFTAIVGRDFEAKAPTGTDILERVTSGAYESRFALLRDMSQNLFWVNRYTLTMFEKRPTRWRDLPRHRSDVFLPLLTPWRDGDKKVRAVADAFAALPSTWDEATERRIFDLLFDVYGNRRHHATELPAVKPTVEQFLTTPGAQTFVVPQHDPDYPVFSFNEILDAHAERARAGGPDPLGDGAAQPVPVGPCRHRAADRRSRSATTSTSSPATRATATSSSSSDRATGTRPGAPGPARPPSPTRSSPCAPLPADPGA